jgi:hypothetical protein
MWLNEFSKMLTDVSEKRTVSIFRVRNEGIFLGNVDKSLPDVYCLRSKGNYNYAILLRNNLNPDTT